MSWDRVAEVAVEKDTRAALLAPMWLKKKKKNGRTKGKACVTWLPVELSKLSGWLWAG